MGWRDGGSDQRGTECVTPSVVGNPLLILNPLSPTTHLLPNGLLVFREAAHAS